MAASESSVGKHFQAAGHEVTLVHCGQLLQEYCNAMVEAGLNYESPPSRKSAVCATCCRRAGQFADELGLGRLVLQEHFSSESRDHVNTIVSRLTPKNWREFEFEGIPVGRYAAYELFLEKKISRFDIDLEYWAQYTSQVSNAVTSIIAWSKVLPRLKPDLVILSNELYSVNRAIRDFCKVKNIPTLTLGHGSDLRMYGNSFTLAKNSDFELKHAYRYPGPDEVGGIFTKSDIIQVGMHFKELASGSNAFAYSSPAGKKTLKEVKRQLNLDDRPIVLALTSSLDERMAGELVNISDSSVLTSKTNIFGDSAGWLKAIIQMATFRPGLQFVIRIHPRLLPNKREGQVAEYAKVLEELLRAVPENVKVNWPSDKVSIYEIGALSSVALNHTSSSGAELLALGVPVVQHDPASLFAYPASLNITATSSEHYVNKVDEALRTGPSIDQIFAVYAWKAWQFSRYALNIENGFPNRAKWTPLRILNGLFIRKKLEVVFPALKILELFELKAHVLDRRLIETLKDIDLRTFTSLLDLKKPPTGSTLSSEQLKVEILRTHLRVLKSTFGAKEAGKLGIFREIVERLSSRSS